MNHYIWISVAFATAMYALLVRGILKHGTEQSMATWGMWALLDLVTLGSVVVQHGNWVLLAFYVCGGVVMCSVLAYKSQFRWTWFETGVVFLVAACLGIWYIVGAKATTVSGTTAVALAGLPQLKDSIQKPNRSTAVVWVGFTLANFFSVIGAKSWAVEEALYPAVCTILTLFLVVADGRDFVRHH